MQSPVWTTRPESWWALLGEWAEIPVECLQCLVASKTRSLAAIIGARDGNTPYWLGIHKTTPTGSIMQKSSLLDEIYHNHHPMISRYAHAANFSNIDKFHHRFTKIHIKQNSAAVWAWMFAQWLILSCLVTSKGVVFAFVVTQSVSISCHKMRAIVPPAK